MKELDDSYVYSYDKPASPRQKRCRCGGKLHLNYARCEPCRDKLIEQVAAILAPRAKKPAIQ